MGCCCCPGLSGLAWAWPWLSWWIPATMLKPAALNSNWIPSPRPRQIVILPPLHAFLASFPFLLNFVSSLLVAGWAIVLIFMAVRDLWEVVWAMEWGCDGVLRLIEVGDGWKGVHCGLWVAFCSFCELGQGCGLGVERKRVEWRGAIDWRKVCGGGFCELGWMVEADCRIGWSGGGLDVQLGGLRGHGSWVLEWAWVLSVGNNV